ncbi:toll/interleukin-1 receptor domain-containing protein [Saccharothrix obliqua]|uniref:toll/interleukin-1 receptor domain-containing protein n=1 Tax=Saccharothrix obliqua TaxID=2861747 RepID=UPI001C5CDB87|nr:toll/interleukin-1 receptor domain-containing protein [Saccharothrix obliqua]MBW4721748.1 toll/interleukin-1 receptor domain-containing protein [Saccharothrix obliqua]
MTSIFINYRRRDDAYAAALLDYGLSQQFGPESVFRAGRSILAGEDYEVGLSTALDLCSAMVVIIGPDWQDSFDASADTSDWVVIEISRALRRNIRVIPVLLSGTERLRADALPPELKTLARLQYLRFDYRNISQDLAHITAEIRRAVPELATAQPSDPRVARESSR